MYLRIGNSQTVTNDYTPQALAKLIEGDQIYWISSEKTPKEVVFTYLFQDLVKTDEVVLWLYDLEDPMLQNQPYFDKNNLQSHIEDGRLAFLRADSVWLKNGSLKPELLFTSLYEAITHVFQRSFSRVRILNEMTWTFRAALGKERISAYVQTCRAYLNDLRTNSAFLSSPSFLLLDFYDREYFKPGVLHELLRCYPTLLLDGSLYENFYFIPQEYSTLEQRQASLLSESLQALQAIGEAERVVEERSRELKQSEAALEMLHSIIESMGDGVFVTNEKGDMLFCNKSSENILGYGLLDLPIEVRARTIGNYLPDMVTPFPIEELPIARACRGESVDQVEIFIRNERRPDGVWVNTTGRPLRDKSGKIVGGVVVTRDVTQIKRAQEEKQKLEEQMLRSQKLESLGVLAGGIAHDFNNLLMGVLGNADLTLKELPVESSSFRRVSQINLAAKRLSDLTTQLLAYSGKGPFIKKSISLNDILIEMEELLKPIVSKKITVLHFFHESLPPICADPTQIRQVVMNLLTNAADAIGDSRGEIRVTTGTQYATRECLSSAYFADHAIPGEYVFLEVSDTGSGMTQETLKKIFEPFFTTKFTGRGLGLASVLGIVRRHHGALQVESKLQEGTCFRVLLPISETQAVSLLETTPSKKKYRGSGGILVVDDEQAVREVAAQMLEYSGFVPYQAESGKLALEIYHKHEPDIRAVILDRTMPDMDGTEILHKLKAKNRELQIIVSSGYHEREESLSEGPESVAAFLHKPYTHDQLIQTLQRVLEGSAPA